MGWLSDLLTMLWKLLSGDNRATATVIQMPLPTPAPVPTPIPQPLPTIDKSIGYVLANEGGYSNIPEDHGGPTNFGITQSDLASWRGHAVSADDVKNMTVDEAKLIYAAKYWAPLHCGELKDQNVATCIFDIGVLHGISGCDHIVQQTLTALGYHDSVRTTSQVIAAINAYPRARFIPEFANQIQAFFDARVAADPTQKIFLKGWTNRANRLLTLA